MYLNRTPVDVLMHVSHNAPLRGGVTQIWFEQGCAARAWKPLPIFNPSSPKGGCTNPPNGSRPGAQNRTAKG